ncbi:uncharacterized protein LOC122575073 isoform X2 [Bombus pyrosoma]|uniref:uncharacterized protein LOC122575073 isoform X2 n=1 Tax=Bombus pyrosoma TaxID=396416 RepID=UPI001CB91764|nr:uncharacterized protein LOC122575073 isoform X2 [Bombus pyrosoma]
MTQIIAILSVIPRLSYHLRIQLPNLTIFDVLPEVAEILKMFGATIWEVTRPPLKENLYYLHEHRTIAHLSEMLTNCDYIINILPSTSSTLGYLRCNSC